MLEDQLARTTNVSYRTRPCDLFFLCATYYAFCLPSNKIPKIKILICGDQGAGKSSYLCSLDSICQGRISRIVNTHGAADGRAVTRKLQTIPISK